MNTKTAARLPVPVMDGQSIYVSEIVRKVEAMRKRVSLPFPAPARAPPFIPRATIPVSSEFFEDR